MRRRSVSTLAILAFSPWMLVACDGDGGSSVGDADSAVPVDSAMPMDGSDDAASPPRPLPGGPRLFFSDLVSGPRSGWEGSAERGAAVTVWGLGFGSERASGHITCGGVDLTSASDYVEWGETTNNARLDAHTPLQRITFFLNASMAPGPTTIRVVQNAVASNEIGFLVRDTGRIYFISNLDGDDSNDGTRSVAQSGTVGPWLTPKMALPSNNPAITAGDITYLRATGSAYTDSSDNDGRLLQLRGDTGTPAEPLVLAGYPGEYPVIDLSAAGVISDEVSAGPSGYFHVARLKFVHGAIALSLRGPGYRTVGCIFEDMQRDVAAGIIHHQPAWDYQILGCQWRASGGGNWKHAVYLTTRDYSGASAWADHDNVNGEVAYSEFDGYECNYTPYGPSSGTGGGIIEIKEQSDDRTHDISVHNNYIHDSTTCQPLWVTAETYDIYFCNNLVVHTDNVVTRSGGGALQLFSDPSAPSTDIFVLHNTFYDVGSSGNSIINNRGGTRTTSRNNLFDLTSGVGFVTMDGSNSAFTSDHDIFWGGALPTGANVTIRSPIDADPQLADTAAERFDLSATSPARNAGEPSSVVTKPTDLLGVPRPQEDSVDVGAYEYVPAD